jgi:hypothetical protein
MPKVSAVIPTTLDEQRLPFIRAALDSVLGQSVGDCEIILVHNGSDPSRKRLIEEYLPSIRYVYEPVGNIGEARNRGVREASGKYVAFLDDDDLWHAEKVHVQASALDDHPDIDVVFTDTELFSDTGVQQESYIRHIGGLERLGRLERAPGLFVQNGSWFEYLIRNCPFLPSCWMGKREVLLDMPFLRILSEDRELLWRLSRKYKLAFVDQVLTRKRDHTSNISLDSIDACVAGMIEGAQMASAWELTPHERALVRRWEADAQFELGYRCRTRGAHLSALRHQTASFVLAPRLLTIKEAAKNLLLWKGRGDDLTSRASASRG